MTVTEIDDSQTSRGKILNPKSFNLFSVSGPGTGREETGDFYQTNKKQNIQGFLQKSKVNN